jgi:hypothetical protein
MLQAGLPHVHQILLAFAYLLFKHFWADFVFQTSYQYLNKGRYGHPGGLLHTAIHVVMTIPVFLILAPASATHAALILLAESLIHYHMDWAKERAQRINAWGPAQAAFWRALGVDQLVHGMTYVLIVWMLLDRVGANWL